jgi:chemotaxis signal transduction protein
MTADGTEQRLEELKKSFDEAFSLPHVPAQDGAVEFLIITAAGQPYALRMSELAGVEVDRRTVPLPVHSRAVLGLCSVQGRLVPVFDLAALLDPTSPMTPARWLALHRDRELVGLAFEQLHGLRRVAARDVIALGHGNEHAGLSREAIRADPGLVGYPLVDVVDIASVIASIRGK